MTSLDLNDIFLTWGFKPLPTHKKPKTDLDLKFIDLNDEEFQSSVLLVLRVLDGDLSKAGPHRRNDWEKGWEENLRKFNKNADYYSTLPGYFEKSKIIRWKQKWIKPNDTFLEPKLLALLVDSLLLKFSDVTDPIYEFGCGTGHHLFRLRGLFPHRKLIGLDWTTSSQELISAFAKINNDDLLVSQNFNFFDPDYKLYVEKNSIFLTVAALEQTHADYKKFIDYILQAKPKIIINLEPIGEFLDSENLLDYLSLRYFTKRNYLSGYFNYLKLLERNGEVIIHDARRSFLGSFFIDGYSIIVWSPVAIV